MEEKIKSKEEIQESADVQPEGTKEQLEAVDERTEDTETKAESANERAEDTETKAESVDERTEDTETKAESADKKAESTDEKPGNREESSECAKNAIAEDGAEDKSADAKGRGSRRKIAGFVELAVAFLLIALSAWLFLNTRGTRLLYVSVATGHISRYYWIFLLAAVVIGVIGLVTLKNSRRAKVQK